MKKLFLSLMIMLASLAAFAQAPSAYSLVVYNQTKCTQYFVVFGDEFCVCGSTYSSTVIAIPPSATFTYPNSIPLFGGTPKGIVGAKILDGTPGCTPNGGTVGQNVCGLPLSYGFMNISGNCTPCAQTKATWYPAVQSCQETAKLVFTP